MAIASAAVSPPRSSCSRATSYWLVDHAIGPVPEFTGLNTAQRSGKSGHNRVCGDNRPRDACPAKPNFSTPTITRLKIVVSSVRFRVSPLTKALQLCIFLVGPGSGEAIHAQRSGACTSGTRVGRASQRPACFVLSQPPLGVCCGQPPFRHRAGRARRKETRVSARQVRRQNRRSNESGAASVSPVGGEPGAVQVADFRIAAMRQRVGGRSF